MALTGVAWYTLNDDVIGNLIFQLPEGMNDEDESSEIGGVTVHRGIYSKQNCHRAENQKWQKILGTKVPEGASKDGEKCKYICEGVAYTVYRDCEDIIDSSDEEGEAIPQTGADNGRPVCDGDLIFGSGLDVIDEDNAQRLTSVWSRAVSNHLRIFDDIKSQGLEDNIEPSDLVKVFDAMMYSGELYHHPKMEQKAYRIRNQMEEYPTTKAKFAEIDIAIKAHPGVALFLGNRPEVVKSANPSARSGIRELQNTFFGGHQNHGSSGFFFEKVPTESNLLGWKGVIPVTNIRWATLGVSCANSHSIREVPVMSLLSSFYGATVPFVVRGVPTLAKLQRVYPRLLEGREITAGRWTIVATQDEELDFQVTGDTQDEFQMSIDALKEALRVQDAVLGVGDRIQNYHVTMSHLANLIREDDSFFAVTKKTPQGKWAPAITKCRTATYFWNGSKSIKDWMTSGSYQKMVYRVRSLPGMLNRDQARGSDGMSRQEVHNWTDTSSMAGSHYD